MKRFVSILLFTFPLCLWAKEDGMAESAMPLVEQPVEATAESISEVPAEAAENPAGAVELTEAEKLIQQELAEIEAENLEAEDVAEADSLAGEGEDVAEGESGAESEEADAELAADMAAADSASADSAVKSLFLDMTASAMPSESRRISGAYGIRTYRMHRGVDLGLCHGEDRTIVAAFAGKVVKTRNQGRRRGYGKYVILDHGNGLTTLYAHLSKWNVKVGDTLQAGDTIGIGGNTGRSFGAHLHFEMRYNGLYIVKTGSSVGSRRKLIPSPYRPTRTFTRKNFPSTATTRCVAETVLERLPGNTEFLYAGSNNSTDSRAT